MKKKLVIIIGLLLSIGSLILSPSINAQDNNLSPTPPQSQENNLPAASNEGNIWIVEPVVTDIGKSAARSGLIFDYILNNYQWACDIGISETTCKNTDSSLVKPWIMIAIFVLLIILLVVTAKSIFSKNEHSNLKSKLYNFIPLFLLILFSYIIFKIIYLAIDAAQGLLLSKNIFNFCPTDCIDSKSILYISWSYQNFVGLRLLGDFQRESTSVNLFLVNLTSGAYNTAVLILLLRKIILWFFIILSPVIILLSYYIPTRKAAKIFIREFIRWLLYAPLFALLLSLYVFMWGNHSAPVFYSPKIDNVNEIIFPTSTNILLGSGNETVTPMNNLNLPETYLNFIFSLLMIWFIILIPWLILHVFLKYSFDYYLRQNKLTKLLKFPQASLKT